MLIWPVGSLSKSSILEGEYPFLDGLSRNIQWKFAILMNLQGYLEIYNGNSSF